MRTPFLRVWVDVYQYVPKDEPKNLYLTRQVYQEHCPVFQCWSVYQHRSAWYLCLVFRLLFRKCIKPVTLCLNVITSNSNLTITSLMHSIHVAPVRRISTPVGIFLGLLLWQPALSDVLRLEWLIAH